MQKNQEHSKQREELTIGGNNGNNLLEFELINNRRLTSCVETNHENMHLPLGEELSEGKPHGVHSSQGRNVTKDRSADDRSLGYLAQPVFRR